MNSTSSSLAAFLGAEFLNFMWPLIASTFLIMAGSALVAREIESGTIELWLSVPESRGKLLAGKLGALAIVVVGLVALTVAALALGAWLICHPLSGRFLLPLGVSLLGLSLSVAGYAALFSALLPSRGRAAGAATGLTLAFYLAWVASSMNDHLAWLAHLSIFSGYRPQTALETGTTSLSDTAALIALAAVCAAGAAVIFHRRQAVA